jgi:hypothetical protein
MVEEPDDVMTPRMYRRFGWIAQVVRNESDVGWAVEMTRVGDSEPALVGPWTMGRDKKNPKPLDINAFHTLIKTANDVLARHEQANRDMLHKSWVYRRESGQSVRVTLEIIPDEDDPRGHLTCMDDATGEVLREGPVSASFRLTAPKVEHFLLSGDRD